jgi:hypothetical protein
MSGTATDVDEPLTALAVRAQDDDVMSPPPLDVMLMP